MEGSNNYLHSERKFATRDITTDLGMKMNPRPRPSGSHEFFASCIKTKTDTVVESEVEHFSEKSRLVMESDGSEAGDEDTKLASRGSGLLRFKRSLRMQLKWIYLLMVARVSGPC